MTQDILSSVLSAKKIFLYGIHGCGMLGLAQWLIDQGIEVIGFDDTPGDVADNRIQLRTTIDLDDIDVVCTTTALAHHHPLYQHLKSFKGLFCKRPELLKAITSSYRQTVAITGTHGKTTTTTLTSFLLDQLNHPHHYFIGGKRLDTDRYAYYAHSAETVVFEADESNSFLGSYAPYIAVVLNAHADHLENFNYSIHAYRQNIINFAKNAFWLVIDKATYDELELSSVFAHHDKIIFLTQEAILESNKALCTTSHLADNLPLYLKTPMSWQHISAAVTICKILGHNVDQVLDRVNVFKGVSYRLEKIETSYFNYVWRDYGHHPNELQNVYRTLTAAYPTQKKIIIFQPHKYSRTKFFLNDFVTILSNYAHVYLLPTFTAQEEFDPAGDITVLHSLLRNSTIVNVMDELIFSDTDQNTIIIFQGAGSIMAKALAWSKDH